MQNMSMSKVIADNNFYTQMTYFDNAREVNDMHSVWSIYEVTDIYADCAIKVAGKKVVYETIQQGASDQDIYEDLKDGGHRSTVEHSMFVGGNTWMDLWKAADSVIRQSGTHHRYIEDFTMNDDGTIELTTGS